MELGEIARSVEDDEARWLDLHEQLEAAQAEA
jgi:hypothetical protein